ncbi:WASH complex subunit 2C [Gastrophryne carolinensis]
MNGPVSGAREEEEPVWERAWSLDEIRRSSHSWSLGADAGLLNFLKDFSHQIISRTHDIEKQLDGLVHEVKTTDCRLHNVFNDFLMLSNTQFIENRVYDEEIEEHIVKPEQGEKHEQEKTREQKEAELIPKIQEAVNYGLKVLETAFEQLDIKAGNSDSEEEEEVNEKIELILEPKDLYIDRPLPYLIGSQLFMQQEDVGLGDVSSEEDSVENDRGSIIDSEEEEDDDEKDNEEDSEEDFGNDSEDEKKLPTALSDEDEDNGSDLFGGSDKEDEEEETDKSSKTRTKSFADELAARIQAEIPKKQEVDQSSISAQDKNKKEKEKKETKPPSTDEDDDIFKPPKLTDEDFFGNKGGLFSGGRGLFDDDEDEEEVEPAPSEVKKKLPYGGVSLFPGGENVISSSILADKDKRKAAAPVDVSTAPAVGSGLFDDDNDVLFAAGPAQPAAKAKPAADLFADDDDLFNDGAFIPPTTSKNKGATDLDKKNIQVPTEKPQPPGPSRKKLTKGLFSDEDDSESDLFAPSHNAAKTKATAVAPPPAKSKSSAALSLFDEDDDLFGAVPEQKPSITITKAAPQPTLPAVPKSQKSVLFSSDEEEPVRVSNAAKPAEKPKKTVDIPPKTKSEIKPEKKSSLFDDQDEEEDLFAITKDSQKKHHRVSLLFEEDQNREESLFETGEVPATTTGQPTEHSNTTAPTTIETEQASLFDERDAKPAPKTLSQSTQQTAPPPLQHDNKIKSDLQEPEADDLFAAPLPTNINAKTKTGVLSLFGDEDGDDGGNLLQSNATERVSGKVSTENSTPAKSTRVFQDEELLFSQELQKDNDPDVDLFASSAKKSTGTSSTGKPSVASGLFGDDDDDDLFSAAKPKKPPKVQEKKTIIKKETLEPPKESKNFNSEKPETALKVKGTKANLHINPAALLPGAISKLSAGRHSSPETETFHTPAAESSCGLDTGRKNMEGVSFETPAQVDTLHSAHKTRVKVSGNRRPPSRMGRKLASQDSGPNVDFYHSSPVSPTKTTFPKAGTAPQADREETISSMKLSFSENDVQSRTKPKAPVNPLTPDVNDLFGSDLFVDSLLPGPSVSRQLIKSPASEVSSRSIKEEESKAAAVFDADASDDDLFTSVKEKPKNLQPSSHLGNEPDDDDLFGAQKPLKKVDVQPVQPKDVKTTTNDIFEDDIFAAEVIKPVKKQKEKKPVSDINLFDDHTDIFSDLTYKQKEKKPKKKMEAKSIFDDDMDDIFSTSVPSVKKSKPKAKSSPPMSETKQDTKDSSAFDDPLNVLGK